MKIIDKRNDYYDHACQYSPEPLWVRKERSVTLDNTKKSELSKNQQNIINHAYDSIPNTWDSYHHDRHIKKYMLGYCGTLVPFYVIEYYDKSHNKDVKKSFTNIDKLIKLWNKEYSKKYDHTMKMSSGRRYYYNPFMRYGFSDSGLSNWSNEHNVDKNLTDIFIALKSPIFIVGRKGFGNIKPELFVNPNLREYSLQNVINAFTAYQDIERYLGNDLVMCNQIIPDFGDELKRDAHGMDEWSFKTKKDTRKRKQ